MRREALECRGLDDLVGIGTRSKIIVDYLILKIRPKQWQIGLGSTNKFIKNHTLAFGLWVLEQSISRGWTMMFGD